ncbi:MAG TPA: gluconate 2-dehydrogenase subunit 3 family protein [Solirubrobacteraceae bacterium]|nr:gluconate 2-dehydrogenase subunit 3 family protein [Solirubrobacteraceae bacterium]
MALEAIGQVAELGDTERATVAAVVDRLIPTDASAPGAAEAGVAAYIERALASEYAGDRDAYVRGVTLLDRHAHEVFGRAFAELDDDERDAALVELEEGRARCPDPLAAQGFFELVLRHAHEGMFGDPRWGGNAGGAGWGWLGYGGPRHEWDAADQRLTPGPSR